ncbi:unnamed protein product, partial [Ilex paraguariensis]
VGADDSSVLDKIIDSLTCIADPSEFLLDRETNTISLKVGKEAYESGNEKGYDTKKKNVSLI